MNKRTVIITGVLVIIIIVAGAAVFALGHDGTNESPRDAVHSPQYSKDSMPQENKPEGTDATVTKTGTIVCLEHTRQGDVQTLECAVGLKLDDGTVYSLNAQNPTLTGSLPTGGRAEVTGTIVAPENDIYKSSGTIKVQAAKRL